MLIQIRGQGVRCKIGLKILSKYSSGLGIIERETSERTQCGCQAVMVQAKPTHHKRRVQIGASTSSTALGANVRHAISVALHHCFRFSKQSLQKHHHLAPLLRH
jgi:ribosomal protein S7